MERDCHNVTQTPDDDQRVTEKILVFLDTGMQRYFIPLQRPQNAPVSDAPGLPEGYRKACEKIEEIESLLPEQTRVLLQRIFAGGHRNDVLDLKSYIKVRFGNREWHLDNGVPLRLYGLWLTIETNTSNQGGTNESQAYDRGIFYQSDGLNEEEKKRLREQYEANPHVAPVLQGQHSYIQLREDQGEDIEVNYRDPETGAVQTMDLGNFRLRLEIRHPNGNIRDTDVILDLGNTRTAVLLFDHAADSSVTFEPKDFKMAFKVLRIKPDPYSGESDEIDDLTGGIVPSWFVLHQLEHQRYKGSADSKEPDRLQLDYRNLAVETESHGLFYFFRRGKTLKITGCVRKLQPQMFMQLAPILIGDQASRVFNFPYAKELIKVGAQVQQSSPKRYYWDDTQLNVWWNMLLNDWDPAYSSTPANATSLPLLQGDMLRFIREDGSPCDFHQELQPHEAPNAYPNEPKYPRQSTLTWFLLHLLERAYAQVNSTFAAGADFIPHRLGKIAITYPSGWSGDEVSRYRERCQEALDIFSQANVYKGVEGACHLTLVPTEQAPDEAVASQLPFVFSEVIRLPGLDALGWCELAGKKRSGGTSVRIMNFDIGGGTSDISIVEYSCTQTDTGNNNLITRLLFKDGHNRAGDDLVRDLIAKIILGSIIRSKGTLPCNHHPSETIGDTIRKCFTSTSTNRMKSTLRARIIRTCLIPLALHCLKELGQESVQFSAKSAGINRNNWDEFLEFIDASSMALSMDRDIFSFSSTDINAMMEDLFRPVFATSAMNAAAFDVDMVIFSGKTSELPYVKQLALNYLPLDETRIIFANEFKPGDWYPFTDKHDYIADAKTVTVVGSALYYALSRGCIAGWSIISQNLFVERNEWGVLEPMRGNNRTVFMNQEQDEATVRLEVNSILARRQNVCCEPTPVYKFVSLKPQTILQPVSLTLKRVTQDNCELLVISAIEGSQDALQDYKLKVWPCEKPSGFTSWQEDGYFDI